MHVCHLAMSCVLRYAAWLGRDGRWTWGRRTWLGCHSAIVLWSAWIQGTCLALWVSFKRFTDINSVWTQCPMRAWMKCHSTRSFNSGNFSGFPFHEMSWDATDRFWRWLLAKVLDGVPGPWRVSAVVEQILFIKSVGVTAGVCSGLLGILLCGGLCEWTKPVELPDFDPVVHVLAYSFREFFSYMTWVLNFWRKSFVSFLWLLER